MEKRTILIANDDGIGAEGIARLAAAALPAASLSQRRTPNAAACRRN